MASNTGFFFCQVTGCNAKFRSLRSLVSHMNLQHSGDKRLGLHCNIDGCTYMYNTVRTFRCHASKRHVGYWENTGTPAAGFAVTDDDDDTPMDVDDVDVNAHEPDTDDETKVNILLNDFAKHLAFLKLKIMEENMLPAAAATSILKDMQVCFNTYQQQFVQ